MFARSLNEVRRMTEGWRLGCNHHRPRRALGGLPPVPFAMATVTSNLYF